MISAISTNQSVRYNNLYLNNNKKDFSKEDNNAEFLNRAKAFKSSVNDDINNSNVVQGSVNKFLSRISYYFSVAAHECKVLIFAGMVAKKPINDYMFENETVKEI